MADVIDTTATQNSTETQTPATGAPTDAAAAGGAAANAGDAGGDAGGEGGSSDGGTAGGDPLDAPGVLDAVEGGKESDAGTDGEGDKSKEGEGTDGADGEGDGDKAGEDAPLTGEVPEAYEVTAPEGVTLDKAALDMFDPVFRKLGLTNAGAQEIVNAAPGFVDHIRDQVAGGVVSDVVAQRKAWAEAAAADPEIGGARFEESKALAAKAFDRLGLAPDGGFRTLLKESGLGNHPDMIRAMVKMGRAIGEDGFERGEAGKADTPIWDRVYGGPTPSN